MHLAGPEQGSKVLWEASEAVQLEWGTTVLFQLSALLQQSALVVRSILPHISSSVTVGGRSACAKMLTVAAVLLVSAVHNLGLWGTVPSDHNRRRLMCGSQDKAAFLPHLQA